ncbi:MAG: hypothetical protein M3441_04215 [Chloroflexota bacterium]|nr:hypothetical protein [Chloroflexota bacterium]
MRNDTRSADSAKLDTDSGVRTRLDSILDNFVANIVAAALLGLLAFIAAILGLSGWTGEQILLAVIVLILLFTPLAIGVKRVIDLQRRLVQVEKEVARRRNETWQLNKILKVDRVLIWALPALVRADPTARDKLFSEVLTNMLKASVEALGSDVQRAVLLAPDKDNEYLNPYVHYGMPQESLGRMRFYIGDAPDRKRGVAGQAYKDREIHVIHVDQSNRVDDSNYIEFEPGRGLLPYKTFAAVPITPISGAVPGATYPACLGVLCFDSASDPQFFDQRVIKNEMLRRVSHLMAAVMIVNEELDQFQHR